jgi:hypothetical protein
MQSISWEKTKGDIRPLGGNPHKSKKGRGKKSGGEKKAVVGAAQAQKRGFNQTASSMDILPKTRKKMKEDA